MFSRLKIRNRVSKDGNLVETMYVLYVNNQEPAQFDSRDALQRYLADFRSKNEVFKLQIYRVETYSL